MSVTIFLAWNQLMEAEYNGSDYLVSSTENQR